MNHLLRLAVAGVGAFGLKHLEALKHVEGVEVASVIDSKWDRARAAATQYGIQHVTDDIAETLGLKHVDGVILCTPTPMHAAQAVACLKAGKHVQVEIPLADGWAGVKAVVSAQRSAKRIVMCGHTRRFNPSHQWIHTRVMLGEFCLHQLLAQTYFFRRTNINALGEPRSWADHLLWHHAAHTVDLFSYQADSPIVIANVIQGPVHPALGIAMDMSIQLKAANGAICTLSLSFNNDGPLGTDFRYIGDRGTYIARYDDLSDGHNNRIDVVTTSASTNGIELQDREFVAAIREEREPNASMAQVLPCYRVLHRLATQLST